MYKIIASDGYNGIIDIDYDINDKIEVLLQGNKRSTKHIIQYNEHGQAYFISSKLRYNLDEFCKI